MAFQPIVDTASRTVFAYEALVRGPNGENAASVLQPLKASAMRYQLDRACRLRAIELAAQLGVARQGAKVSINFMPASIQDAETCIRTTLHTAERHDFPLDALIFEILEDERIDDIPHLRSIVSEYHKHGFHLALDDFGAGYSGLSLLAKVSADILKLDAGLIRDLDHYPRTRSILCHTVAMCNDLGMLVVGEAVETLAEYNALRACGVTLMQGFLLARPAFEALPSIHWPS